MYVGMREDENFLCKLRVPMIWDMGEKSYFNNTIFSWNISSGSEINKYDAKDLILFSHLKYKSPYYFELLQS